MRGKVCVITGANTGIGRVTAVELASRGARVILACRSKERTQPVIDEIAQAHGDDAVAFVPLDLASLTSVRACAEQILAMDEPLDVLITNAGLAGTKGLTEDGFELTIGVNHIGHFLLIELLLEKLKASAPARIVIVASRGHRKIDRLDFDQVRKPTKTFSGFPEYCQSKAMNILHARELGRRLEGTGVTAYSLHPGVVASDVWRKVPWPIRALMTLRMISNEEGAQTTLYCATEPSLAERTGRYYDECAEAKPFPPADDDRLAAELYERSLEWVGLAPS
jgi:retinol dehydrogenase 12